jgi:anti-sigma B factor antagonist
VTQQGGIRAKWCGDGIQILPVRGELDLATADRLAARGCAAVAREVWLLLLDLSGLWFCDARGASALVRIANHADSLGCRFGLIAPQPLVAKLLRITRLDQRMPVFTTVDDALATWPASAPARGERTPAISLSHYRQSSRSRTSPGGRVQNPQVNTVTGANGPAAQPTATRWLARAMPGTHGCASTPMPP